MQVKAKKLSREAILPRKATSGAAAYDVYVPEHTLVPRGRSIVPLHIAMEVPQGYQCMIEPRSGYSAKGMEGTLYGHEHELSITKRFDADVIPGKIDSDYRGEIGVIISNRDESFTLNAGQRIAQMTFTKVEEVEFEESEELTATSRGNGGFGHTGTY